MKRELDPRLVIGLIALLILICGILAWRQFGPTGGGPLTPAQAGLGKPLHPGESLEEAEQRNNPKSSPAAPNQR